MTLSIEPAEPVTMEVALGCGTPRTLSVHWEDGTLYAREGTLPQLAFQPSLESWKHFWRAADKANVWEWSHLPETDLPVLWRIALDSGMKRVIASGSSSSTSEFKTFARALKTLLPGVSIPLAT